MKLLKILVVIFLIYFIRRFIQMYKVVKTLNANQAQSNTTSAPDSEIKTQTQKNDKVVEADFKVMD